MSTATTAPEQEVTRSPWASLIPLCLAVTLYKLDTTIVNVALPSIQQDLHTSQEATVWTVSSYILALTMSIPLAGALGDRLGRRRVFVFGMVLFGLFSGACALAPSDLWLIILRFGQGLAAGVLIPLSMAIVGASFRGPDLTTAYGLWSGTSSIGFVIGPLIGGVLVKQVGWQSVFWVNVPLSPLLVPLTYWLVDESSDPNPRPLDLVGMVLSTVGLALVAVALIGTTRTAWGAPGTLIPLLGGVGVLAAFTAWEFHTDHPLLPMGFFKARGFALGGVIGAIVYAFPAALLFLTLYFQGILGDNPERASLLFIPLALALTVVAVLAGPITKKVGAINSTVVGMGLMAAGAFGLAGLTTQEELTRLIISEVLLGVGIMLAVPATSAVMMESIPREQASVGSAVMQAFRQVGALLFVGVLSAVAAAKAKSAFTLPGGEEAAHKLLPDVIGAQMNQVKAAAGGAAADAAASAWIQGLRAAMLLVAAMAALGVLLCLVTAVRRSRAQQPVKA